MGIFSLDNDNDRQVYLNCYVKQQKARQNTTVQKTQERDIPGKSQHPVKKLVKEGEIGRKLDRKELNN